MSHLCFHSEKPGFKQICRFPVLSWNKNNKSNKMQFSIYVRAQNSLKWLMGEEISTLRASQYRCQMEKVLDLYLPAHCPLSMSSESLCIFLIQIAVLCQGTWLVVKLPFPSNITDHRQSYPQLEWRPILEVFSYYIISPMALAKSCCQLQWCKPNRCLTTVPNLALFYRTSSADTHFPIWLPDGTISAGCNGHSCWTVIYTY